MTRPLPEDEPDIQSSQTSPRVETQRAVTDRRFVLRASGVVAGAGALAACSSPPLVAPTTISSSTSSAVGATSTASTASPVSTEASTTAPSGSGTPTSEVPVGGGTIYAGERVVVTQPTAGEFKAFDTTCTHQGCAVTSVAGGHIICPCHGSQFDVATGAPTADSEAKQPLASRTITVTGDTFSVS